MRCKSRPTGILNLFIKIAYFIQLILLLHSSNLTFITMFEAAKDTTGTTMATHQTIINNQANDIPDKDSSFPMKVSVQTDY